MNLVFYLKLNLVTVLIFFTVDLFWLGFVARRFYRAHLDGIVNLSVNWKAAIVFYLVYIVGILVFAVIPAIEKGSLQQALIWGALFGFFTYATYDLTNMATIRQWPLTVVAVDIAWGTILCAAVAALSFLAGNWIGTG